MRTGTALRATLIRPEQTWRVPIGIGRGLRLAVDSQAPLHKYFGTAEMEISKYVKQFARLGYQCFDVGGHDAQDALTLARRTQSEVITFEFNQACLSRMERNLALNPTLAVKVRIVPTYVAHESQASPRTDTLDNLIETGEVFEPDFVKVDVEGAEAAVLGGARRLLASRHSHFVIETHSLSIEAECAELLRSAGYAPIVVNQRR